MNENKVMSLEERVKDEAKSPRANLELLAVVDGYRESTQSWRELLQQLKRQGLQRRRNWLLGMARSASGLHCGRSTAHFAGRR